MSYGRVYIIYLIIIILFVHRPPVTGSTEFGDDGYLILSTESAECVYSLDMPGEWAGDMVALINCL